MNVVPAHPRLLRAARVVWLLYAVSILLISLASLPAYHQRVTTGTVPDISFDVAWPAGNAYFIAHAAVAELPLPQYVTANMAVSLLILAVHYVVAGLIYWRLPKSWFGLLSAFVILFTGSSALQDAIQVAELVNRLGPFGKLVFDLGALVWPVFPLWLYLFPDGRAVPRWARWPITVLMGVFALFMVTGLLDTAGLLPPALWQAVIALNERTDFIVVLVLPGLVMALASQIYRYRRVSGPVERQQTKWFIFGLALFVAFFPLADFGPLRRLDAMSGSIGLIIIPISIGIALLRYRLWDVDVVVRRTAGYALLTGLLALVYFGSIVVLQRLLAPFTGETTLATILSTLLIAALFLPLRRRIQEWIDRRFYRRKYDAAKVLQGFTATARDETDLEKLTAELLRVIQETMEPESVALWLKPASSLQPEESGARAGSTMISYPLIPEGSHAIK